MLLGPTAGTAELPSGSAVLVWRLARRCDSSNGASGRRFCTSAVLPVAGQAHRGLRNRLEHDKRNGRAACTAVAVSPAAHTGQGQFDVVERPSSTGSDDRVHFSQSRRGVAVSSGAVRCSGRGPSRQVRHVELSQLLAPEVALPLQRSAQSRDSRGDGVAPALGRVPGPGGDHVCSKHAELQVAIAPHQRP